MSDTKVILLNGPSMAGKDVAAEYLMKGIGDKQVEYKDHLYTLVQQVFNISEEEFWRIYGDRKLKEVPQECFSVEISYLDSALSYGFWEDWNLNERAVVFKGCPQKPENFLNLSSREALIFVSELMIKPAFGNQYFGRCAADSLQEGGVNIIASAGFVDETYPIINKVGLENILLIRVYRDGCTFDGDSRNYLPDELAGTVFELGNDGTLEEWYQKVEVNVMGWLNE